ncbi:hypothetical protein P43SY_001914 [Pythium insidiosum]|uniref:Uncharacterized protein n=1 Tax=Pythium insidiosum TaxID=114742 RepID=A0AAD5Q5M2_PYTIN|nr:hypothetical protein P43SY_001914 [Pythium insidiosum]
MASPARRWSFHSVLLASGQSAIELASRQGVIAALAGDAELAAWSRQTSYRVIQRTDVEASLRMLLEDRARAEMEAAQTPGDGEDSGLSSPPTESAPVIDVVLTPETLALGFQRLVADDKRSFLAAGAAPYDAGAAETSPSSAATEDATPPARIYLLTDYPATRAEVHALLSVGEMERDATAGGKPLLPLIDGVVVVLDTLRELRERRRSLSQSTNGDDRRKSVSRHVDGDLKDASLDRSVAASAAFQQASPFVKELLAASSIGALEWSDFVFTDLPCCSSVTESKPVAELVKDLTTALDALGSQKAAFKEWVANVQIRPFPSSSDNDQFVRDILAGYSSSIDRVYPPSMTVAVVVAAMRDAVSIVVEGSDSVRDPEDNNDATPEPFMEHGDTAAIRLAIAYDLYYHGQEGYEDSNTTPSHFKGDRIDCLEKRMWRASDLPGVGNAGRKWLPREPRLSLSERLVRDAELTTFTPTTISLRHIHLVQQLLRFEDLLGVPWKGRLRARSHIEQLSEDVLPQRLAELVRESPLVLKEYDESQDALLVAILNATAPGRFRTTTWSAKDHVRHRPAFKDWKRELPFPPEYLTPRTEVARNACVPLSSGELTVVSEKCSILYPSDQSIVRLFQCPSAPSWLTVSLDGLLTIREGRRMARKPDGHGTVAVTHTVLGGVSISVSSDGLIVQRSPCLKTESYRVISGRGSVTCVSRDGARQILLPNGDTISISADGTQRERDGAAQRIAVAVDPETNALIEARESGVLIVTHTDGSRIAYHRNGTRILTTASRSHALVTAPGFADTCIDIGVNLAAQRHGDGQRVAVTKGGLRTRSIVRASDGAQLEAQYNTKVVAEVNGRVVVSRLDGARVVAKDSGRVEFLPSSLDHAAVHSAEDDDRDVLEHNGVYYFSCRDGAFSLCDAEQNAFHVDIGDGRGIPSVSAQLAGVLSEADAEKYGVQPIPARPVINDPIEPFLFVLHGDGTGTEILRERDDHVISDQFAKLQLEFTVVRQLQQLRPFESSRVDAMLQSVERWREWERLREATKDRFKVEDPRSNEQLSQEVVVQRKVLAAYKAVRAKKKLERQKQREQQRKLRQSDEPTADQGQADGDDEELAFLGSDSDADSTGDVDVEVDDPDELMWTAYSAADTDGFGRLSLMQARHGLVEVLGVGISVKELTELLKKFRQSEPFEITFDVFVDLAHAFKKRIMDDDEADEGDNNAEQQAPPRLRLAALEGERS